MPQVSGAVGLGSVDGMPRSAPSWPRTRLASWSLTIGLAAGIAAPTAVSGAELVDWLALLPAVGLATAAARGASALTSLVVRGRHWGGRVLASLPAALLAAALMAAVSAAADVSYSRVAGGVSAALTWLVLVGAREIREIEVQGRLALRRVFFVGSATSQDDLARELARRYDATLVGGFTLEEPLRIMQLIDAVTAARATVIVLDADAMRSPECVEATARLNLMGVRVRDLVSYYELEFKKVPLAELSPTWFLFDVAGIDGSLASRFRRACDICLSAVLLVVSLPLMVAAAVAIKLTSPGPALYRQRRVGISGSILTLLKLRTMTEPDPEAADWAPSQVHRLTPVGRVLRRFRIDELPQLLNVIRGDLALIGPRPEQVPIVGRLTEQLPYYAARHCIKPGLTGWAQVKLGYSGSLEGTVAKLQHDLFYIKHRGLRLDLLIVWLTMKAVVAGEWRQT